MGSHELVLQCFSILMNFQASRSSCGVKGKHRCIIGEAGRPMIFQPLDQNWKACPRVSFTWSSRVIGDFTNYGRGPELLPVLMAIAVHGDRATRTTTCRANLLALAQKKEVIPDLSYTLWGIQWKIWLGAKELITKQENHTWGTSWWLWLVCKNRTLHWSVQFDWELILNIGKHSEVHSLH